MDAKLLDTVLVIFRCDGRRDKVVSALCYPLSG